MKKERVQTPYIELSKVNRFFGITKALEQIDFQIFSGEVIGLVGPNGAGKSTMMKMLYGMYGIDDGEIIIGGEKVENLSPKIAIEKGIGMVHQEFMLVDELTVLENVILGFEPRKGLTIDFDSARKNIQKYIDHYGMDVQLNKKINQISVGEAQRVEIIKTLTRGANIIILDEPTAVLTPQETQRLFEILQNLKNDGKSIVFISHKLNEISYVADKITVIRDGSTIETLDKKVDDFSEQRIIQGMVGREMTDRFPKRPDVRVGAVSMEVKNWTVYHPLYSERKVVDNVSFKIHKGEVVGISGLMGAGRTELAMSIFGKSYGTKISGQIFMNGKEVKLNTVQEAIDNKLAYVTEDRKGNGLILSKSIKMNTSLANMKGISNGQVIDADKEYAVAEEYRKKLKTKCPSVEQNVGNLSGGNQQKVLLAKWMFAEPDILILDEPTRGIDVGAKYEIYCIINDLVAAGKSVIMISSELPEVLGMSDRIYIMNEGKFVGEVSKEEATSELIMSKIVKSGKGA